MPVNIEKVNPNHKKMGTDQLDIICCLWQKAGHKCILSYGSKPAQENDKKDTSHLLQTNDKSVPQWAWWYFLASKLLGYDDTHLMELSCENWTPWGENW